MKTTEKRDSGLYGELVSTPDVDVPFAPGFSLEGLHAVDPDPLFTTVKITSGKGDQGTGPYYGPDILQSLEQQFNNKRPPGFLGHQDPEKVSFEWRNPVTAWLGAKIIPRTDGEVDLYVKGYVPPTAEDLRTQLRLAASGADVVNSVSIFGGREIDQGQVTAFDLWSLDWTPKGRAGMETELISVSGEQAKEEERETMELDRKEILRSLRATDVPDHVTGEIQKIERDKVVAEHQPLVAAVGEMRVILEITEGEDPVKLVDAVRELVGANKDADLEARVEKQVAEMQTTDLVKSAVQNAVLPSLSVASTDEEIGGEIKSALELPYIAALSDGTTIPVIQGGVKKTNGGALPGTSWA